MKKLVSGVMLMVLVSSISAVANLEVRVTPQGDGMAGKERWGGNWDTVDYYSNANPNSAFHWYEYGDGQWRDVYMQVGLSTLPNADSITNATLYINVLGISGDGCSLKHASDSSAANGNASQKIGGNELVTTMTSGSGWLGIDVTDFIKNDVTNGCDYAAFTFIHDGYSAVTFSSGECDELAPYLSVVPEPATLSLLALGAVTMLRRKK